LCQAIFGNRAVKDWRGLVAIEAPDRTQHAAIVPVVNAGSSALQVCFGLGAP
jgi:RNA polymerase subunit RPABC4/transcription elongation factor Spt4